MNKEDVKVIVGGVVATAVFVYFLDPILHFFGNCLLRLSASLFHTYYNRIYAQAAHLETQDYAFLLLVTVGMMPLICFFILDVQYLVRRTRHGASPDKPPTKSNFRTRLLLLIVTAIFMLTFTVIAAANYTQLSLISSFRQHMRILSPYVSEQDEKMLYSKWSLMNSREDYVQIYERLNAIALKNGITLPKNRIYSPATL